MEDFLYIAILVVIVVVSWTSLIIFERKKKERAKKIDNIYSAISISNITSIPVIAQTLGLNVDETRGIIEEIINKSKYNKRDYKLLKNAYIDNIKDKVIINPKAKHNVLNKTIDYVLDGFSLKKEIKKDWICQHCNTLNKNKIQNCLSCGANKSEEK